MPPWTPGPRFALLGPLEVLGPDGSVPVRSRLQRLLLTVLVLQPGRTVSTDRLVDELWGGDLPHDPVGTLRSQVSRLRKRLPEADQVASVPGGYRLAALPEDIDVGRFERLVAGAASQGAAAALTQLESALSLWRGPPLEEFSDHPFAAVERHRLEQLRASAREQQAVLLLDTGRVAEAAAAADALLADHPERESVRAVLMAALHQQGRSREALAGYRAWRQELLDSGLDPSPRLRALETEILRHELTTPEPARGQASRRSQPPRPTNSFVGRRTDVLGVTDLLRTERLVTLWGTGGAGKTRLALEVLAQISADYPDGIHFCELAPLRSHDEVMHALADRLGLEERRGVTVEDQVVTRLAEGRILLVLDSCEHVLPVTARLAQQLLLFTPAVVVLATSRERLGTDGEQVWEVAPLDTRGPTSAATALFLDRARATNPSFEPTDDDLEAINAVCQHLDGLPLAVELAAARIRGLPPRELLDELAVHPEVLGRETAVPRHRTLHAVIDWSYAMLDAREQQTFERLSVFSGPFGLGGAQAVAGDDAAADGWVDRSVLRLLDCAMLQERPGSPRQRFSMLGTVRRFGLGRLHASGGATLAERRHATWVLTEIQAAARGLAGADEAHCAVAIGEMVDELRGALRWMLEHDQHDAQQLVSLLRPYALWRGHHEVFRWAELATTSPEASASAGWPDAMLTVATGACLRGDLHAAERAAQAVADRAGADHRAVLEASAEVALLRGDLSTAITQYVRGSRAARLEGDWLQATWDVGSAAIATGYAGRTSEALRLAAEASEIAASCGSPTAAAFAHFTFGEILAEQDPVAADDHLRQAVDAAQVADARLVLGLAEVAMAASRNRQRDLPDALAHCESALHRWHQQGSWTPLWVTIRTLIDVLVRADELAVAAVLLTAVTSAQRGVAPFGADARRLAQAEQVLRQRLGAEFEHHAAAGRSMSDQDIVLLASDSARQAASRLRRRSSRTGPLAGPGATAGPTSSRPPDHQLASEELRIPQQRGLGSLATGTAQRPQRPDVDDHP
jgi:predicted ATPase/DNA-binding SARP family transcriptional activator